ncbi:uncharacterized protein LOC126688103 [Mercurialis annua]|uniref:uncharacterized protein LOC126688103 n=1 Tax=Mercurialis annua TaxID=3986 RepID=UPI0021601253|nr:uncharacterized protein LOC126688103 [Mercurialis annua]
MDRVYVLAITALILSLSEIKNAVPLPFPQPQRPLCVSQLTLANYACGRLPITPSSEYLAESPLSDIVFPDDDQRLGVMASRRHDRHHEDLPTNDCCRWLNDLDDECVCELLVHLPPFLARPIHQYTVIVGSSCNVTYSCSGRLRP